MLRCILHSTGCLQDFAVQLWLAGHGALRWSQHKKARRPSPWARPPLLDSTSPAAKSSLTALKGSSP